MCMIKNNNTVLQTCGSALWKKITYFSLNEGILLKGWKS